MRGKTLESRIPNSECGNRVQSSAVERSRASSCFAIELFIFAFCILHSAFGATFSRDNIEVSITTSPEKVRLDRDFELILQWTAPEGLDVVLPKDFSDRLEGLKIEGSYEDEAVSANGLIQRTLHLRTRPVPAASEYRFAPFPVLYGNGQDWFPTKPIVFEAESLLKEGESVGGDVVVDLKPIWIMPSWKVIGRWALGALAALCGIGILYFVYRKVRRRIVIMRMAPRERALLELRELLDRHLPEKGETKRFYLLLTGIVRRYIERRHKVRAPELTTEEFLKEATQHPAFSSETLTRLREFLAAADMVKFAGIAASAETVEHSTAAARRYLEGERN